MKSMHRYLSFYLLIATLVGAVFFQGCGAEGALSEDRAATVSQTEADASDEESIPDYRTIPCRAVNEGEWAPVRILDRAISAQVEVKLPGDWTLEQADHRNYRILRQGSEIGALTMDALPTQTAEFAVKTAYNKINVRCRRHVAWRETEAGGAYDRVLAFSCRQNGDKMEFSLWVDYKELNEDAVQTIADSPKIIEGGRSIPGMGETNAARKILILGNSFVGTSKIGAILEDMLISGQTGVEVDAVSIGMADVTTFAERSDICGRIQSGNYSHVFLCGFYSDEVLEDLNMIRGVCHISKTALVVFPAHNEKAATVRNALAQYSGLLCLDWKGKINELLEAGVPEAAMCIHDSHKHSTPLAGYVGANLIWQVLFDTPVPKLSARSPLSDAQVNEKLGQYQALLDRERPFEGVLCQMN